MEKKFKRTTVTSALPYANGPVHIGHLAGVYVPADIYVRYLRLKKEDVLFIGGSDEHGVPITIRAKKEGITPQDVVDRYHKIIKDSFSDPCPLFPEDCFTNFPVCPVGVSAVVLERSEACRIFCHIGLRRQTGVSDRLYTIIMVMECLGDLIANLRVETSGNGRIQVLTIEKPRFRESHILKLGVPRTDMDVDLKVRA